MGRGGGSSITILRLGVGVGVEGGATGATGATDAGFAATTLPGIAGRLDRPWWGRRRLSAFRRGPPVYTYFSQGANQGAAARKPLVRTLSQRPADDALVGRRKGGQVRLALHVLHDELMHIRAAEGTLAGQQFLVDDRQAVLIAKTAHQSVKRLRRGVNRRHPARHRRRHSLQVLDQSEVGHLDVIVNQENVLRFDVEMLKLILIVHQVKGFRALLHDVQKLAARNPQKPLRPAFLESIPEIAIGQLHHNQQLAVDNVVAFERENIGMTDGLHAAEGFELLFGPLSVRAGGLQVSVDKLDGFEQPAGSFTLPNLPESASAQALDELVTGDRLCSAFEPYWHGHFPVESRKTTL